MNNNQYENRNKKIKWYDQKWFTVLLLLICYPLGLVFMWSEKHFTKDKRVVITILFVLITLFGIIPKGMKNARKIPIGHSPKLKQQKIENMKKAQEEREEQERLEAERIAKEKNIETEIDADLKVDISNDKVNIKIETNAIDGSIFEYFIIYGNLETEMELIEVKDGVAKSEIDIDDTWEPGYLFIGASMPFNLEESPQPENVRKAYGENGEKLKGDLIEENNLDGYNISIEIEQIAYPDIETVEKIANENLNNAIDEAIKLSEGVIISIKKDPDNKFSFSVVVSDTWYYLLDHQKERFAEQIGGLVKKLAISSGAYLKGDPIMVYFYDSYNKELASPKVFGGYKIKR